MSGLQKQCEAEARDAHLDWSLGCARATLWVLGLAYEIQAASKFYENAASMSHSRDLPMEAKVSEADLIINRMNLALARSQRLINSWLPPKSADDEAQTAEDREEDFRSMTDEAGIGSKAAYGDDETSPSLLHKRRLASGNKLLEQLLGKKAAQAHKKSQSVGKSMAASRHAAPKPLTSRPKPTRKDVSESEEEGGRSTAFKSRKDDKGSRSVVVEPSVISTPVYRAVEDQAVATQEDSDSNNEDQTAPGLQQSLPVKAAKNKRGISYLDEVLGQRAKKKKKKAKHIVDS